MRAEISQEQFAEKLVKEGLPHLPYQDRKLVLFGYVNGFIDKLKLLNLNFLFLILPRVRVGVHEAGHEAVIKANNDYVSSITIIPEGNTLGTTSWVSNPSHSQEQIFGNRIAASHGGEAAEGFMGEGFHPGAGSGSDRGSERFWDDMLRSLNGGYGNISHHLSRANEIVNSKGRSYFSYRAWTLALQGTVIPG